MTTNAKLSQSSCEQALAAVAEWMGRKGWGVPYCKQGLRLDSLLRHNTSLTTEPHYVDCGAVGFNPAPTGEEAARSGSGPMLIMEWDFPSSGPKPSIILEGGPEDWAYDIWSDQVFSDTMKRLGIYAEPYASYALCLYPEV